MRKVLWILGELKDSDVDWLVGAGTRETIAAGTNLVRQGQPIDAFYFVLSGRFAVTTGAREVATLGPGEVIGELSYLDSRPPTATVTAKEPSQVMTISRDRLSARLGSDFGFASRFYRALGVFLADRLRSTVGRMAYGDHNALDEDVEAEDELSPDMLEGMGLAAARFEAMLKR